MVALFRKQEGFRGDFKSRHDDKTFNVSPDLKVATKSFKNSGNGFSFEQSRGRARVENFAVPSNFNLSWSKMKQISLASSPSRSNTQKTVFARYTAEAI